MIDQAFDAIRLELGKRLLAAGVALVIEHQKKLNILNPPPHDQSSKPGEYPRKRTGFGQAGVLFEPVSPAEAAKTLRVKVGFTKATFYLQYLAEAKHRLGILDTLKEMRTRLEKLIGEGNVSVER